MRPQLHLGWAAGAGVVVVGAALLGGGFAPATRLVLGMLVILTGAAGLLRRLRPTADELVLLALLAWGAMSAVVLRAAPLDAKTQLGGWAVAWLLLVGARRLDARARRALAVAIVAGAVGLAAGVAAEAYGQGRLWAGGFVASPNEAAALLLPSLAALTQVGLAVPGALALAGLLTAGLVASASRAAALALPVLVLALLPPGRARRVLAVAAVVGLAVVFLWRSAGVRDPLAWHRIEIWSSVAALVTENPVLGVSPGGLDEAAGAVRMAHPTELGRFGHRIGAAESTPLAVLVETGLPGLLLLLGAAAAFVARLRHPVRPLAPAGRAALAAMLVVALFHDLVRADFVLWWWALVLGLCDPVPDPAGEDGRPVPLARVVLAAVTATALAWAVVQPSAARLLHRSGADPQHVLRMEPWSSAPARDEVRRLLAASPWRWPEAAAALDWSQVVVEVEPRSYSAWSLRAQVCVRAMAGTGSTAGLAEEARSAFARAVELEPSLPWSRYRWALLERSLGEPARAGALARAAVLQEPEFVRGWLLVARVELDAGRPGAARAALEQAQRSRRRAAGRLLTDYQRELLLTPEWQLRQLRAELP